jgi:hypothetical protein
VSADSDSKEAVMSKPQRRTPAAIAILTLAEIKTAAKAFDNGECNLFDSLDAISAAVVAYRATVRDQSPGDQSSGKQSLRKRSRGEAA